MAIIPQIKLFEWTEIQTIGDLVRLRLVLDYMPDEELMRTLERSRGKGRNDYPVRAIWNSILAGIVFQHESVEKLRRELARNGQLRELCGFNEQVPSPWAYTRFLKALMKQENLIDEMFEKMVKQLSEMLPDFGKNLAMDSKAITSFAKHKNKKGETDGRRDTEADYSRKEYRGVHENGKTWEKIVKWFGYKLHLIVDATMVADRGYDDTKLITKCWDKYRIKPVIDIRNLWRDGDRTRLLTNYKNVAYNYKGNVYCYCPETGTQREMSNGGFEKDRGTLKKLCPAKRYGIKCQGMEQCSVSQGIRIPLAEDRRIFTPIDRASRTGK